MSKISTHSPNLVQCLFSIGSCLALLALAALPSRSEPTPIAQKSNPNPTWILLQQQGNPSYRQMQFTQTDSLLPVVDEAMFSRLIREPEPNAEIRAALSKSTIWSIRLVTVNESVMRPGYINAHAEVDCENKKLRITERTAVPYADIKSPEDEVTKAIKQQSQIVYRQLRTPPIAMLSARQGEPWQPLSTNSPVYQFVCQNPAWRNAIAAKQSIPETELAQFGFSPIAAVGTLPQQLFAYTWQNVWTDGKFPKLAHHETANPMPHPQVPTDLETLRTAARLEGRALGVAAHPSKLYQAFEQARQVGATIQPDIERLLREGTSAGRIYAAMVLVSIDPEAGRQALEQMRSDQTPLTEASGCTILQTSVGAAVTDILQGRSSVFLPLP